jgi:hypothetical protein
MSLDATTMKRLAFINHVFRVAVEQSHRPEPLSYTAILGFQDSVELFLILACDFLGVGKKDQKFLEYFNTIQQKLGSDISERRAMIRLNETRVALKHYGTWPNTSEIEDFRINTGNFFYENTPLVFGISYNEISMAHVVVVDKAREALLTAEHLAAQKNFQAALESVAVAFERLLVAHGTTSMVSRPSTFQFYGDELGIRTKEFERLLDRMNRNLTDLQHEVGLLRYGIDLRRLAAFKRVTPSIGISMADTPINFSGWTEDRATVEQFRFCYDFVIEAALKMQAVWSFAKQIATPTKLDEA